jgi:DNA-binding transcriptional ArsR family regulator
MKKKILEFQAEVCKTFSNYKRLEVINLLKDGELTASDIAQALATTKANTSQHLAVMRMRGLLKTRREGTSIYYRIANEKLAHACNLMRDALAQITESEGEGLHENRLLENARFRNVSSGAKG